MTATELYKAGKLTEAIDAQLQEVKAHPADHGKRLFLFELLVFAGDLERAKKHVEIVNYGQLELDAAVMAYRRLLDAEAARRSFFKDGVPPKFFGEQPEHVHWRIEAWTRMREGRPAEAAQCLAKADETAPPIRGKLDDRLFESFRDCDDLFGTVIEVMAQNAYFWVPLEQVETIQLTPPKTPRDLIWRPGRLEMKESAGNVFLPTLYPMTHEASDPNLKLGRLTDWKTVEGGPTLGVGTHLFLVDDHDISILEWKTLELGD
jgi:type VI secretion system protein ImpE